MKKYILLIIILISTMMFGISVFAAEPVMSVQNNILTVENAPKDSTLFVVSCQNGQIAEVSMVKGEELIKTDVSEQSKNADMIKAFLWDFKTLKPLMQSKTITAQAEKELILKIDSKTIPVIWEDNDSVKELKKQAEKAEINISMSNYGGFEQVGHLGKAYPSNDRRINAEKGDIMLYSSNQIVVFYGKNTWSYTKLGKITLDPDEVTTLLDNKGVTLTISVEQS